MQTDSSSADRKVRQVRLSQLALITMGVLGSLLPALFRPTLYSSSALVPLALFAALLMPVAYVYFTLSVERAAREFLPEGRHPRSNVPLGVLLFLPCIGGLLEIVLLYRLARLTAEVEGARDRSGIVLVLALLRNMSVAFTGLLFSSFLFPVGTLLSIALYAFIPLVSLAILGLITQIIAAPLLDQLMPQVSSVRLGGAGATSSMAVPSSSGTSNESRRL